MSAINGTKQKIIELLELYALDLNASRDVVDNIAIKCFEMGHLYSDMGFKSRVEMNTFMSLHFPELAKKRPVDIRWKKFLFDSVGEIAPACWQCKDSQNCFKCDILEQSA